MDLQELETIKEIPLDVPIKFDADGNATEGFKVVSSNSPQYQDAERAYKQANYRKAARRGRPIDARTDEGARELAAMVEEREIALACAVVVEMYGFTVGGAPAEVNGKNLKIIFTKRPSWRQKVLAASENDAVFTESSSES